MSDNTKVINSSNVEIQHSIYVTDETALRKNCAGIMLEIIKSMAAAGANGSTIKGMIENLDENAEKIFQAVNKKK